MSAGAHRDAAVLALATASLRLENVRVICRARPREPVGYMGAALCEVLEPLVQAVAELVEARPDE